MMKRRVKIWNLSLLTMLAVLAASASTFAEPAKIKIILVGDSTVTDNAGWGLGFKLFLNPDQVELINTSRGGRSSQSFMTEGRWTNALALHGDYYLIQFGHNNEPGKPGRSTDMATFVANMQQYVDDARAIGAKPILVTPLTRRQWDKEHPGKIKSSLAPYAEEVRKIGVEKNVPVVDLQARSIELCESLGPEKCLEFSPLKTNADGTIAYDGTHLSGMGRVLIARLVVEYLRKVVPELSPVLRTEPLNANPLASETVMAQSWVIPALPKTGGRIYHITNFGAVGDGVATNTLAIQAAIDAANGAGGGTVEVPEGTFLSGPIHFASSINFRVNGTLRMLPLGKYPGGTDNPENFISGRDLHDIAISGSGSIDGQGSPWWPYAKTKGAKRPRMIAFSSCERVLIENVTLSNSPMFHIAISGKTTDVTVRGVTIRAPASTDPVNPSHNTDACDVTGKRILIQDCDVSVGDDNYTCGGGTSDVLITNCTYGYGHGVSIGSPTSGGISNFTVINCTFNNTEAGIRIKSDRDRGGFLHNLSYLNLRMTNVDYPILIYASYMTTNREFRALNNLTPAIAASYPSNQVISRTPIYRDITFSNLTATVKAGRRAGLIWGLPEMPVNNVLLQRVTITADKPFGIYDAQNVRLVDCQIITPEGVNKLSSTNAQITITPP
jgi:polygalacturonase